MYGLPGDSSESKVPMDPAGDMTDGENRKKKRVQGKAKNREFLECV